MEVHFILLWYLEKNLICLYSDKYKDVNYERPINSLVCVDLFAAKMEEMEKKMKDREPIESKT